MNWRLRLSVRLSVCLAALVLAAASRAAQNQPVAGGEGFKFSEYYEAPHETQMKWLMECGQAQRQPDGRVQATQVKYRTYRATGEGDLLVEAPECVYDPDQRAISSPGTLHAQRADGSFTIDGEGFLWQQTNTTLLVSNRVHTTIHPELLQPAATASATNTAAATGPGIDIFSDQFEFGQTTGRGAYRGHVRVTGTNLLATAGRLVIVLPQDQHRLQSLTAEEQVVVDYDQVHAAGDWAYYSEDTGLVQLKGQPSWRMGEREGSGDDIIFDRTNRVLRATGHARLQMPAAGMGGATLFATPDGARTNSTALTNDLVEVLCDNYVLQTNLAVFRKDVRVVERRGEDVQGQMTCGLMTLTFLGTNQLDKLIAEPDVVISQADRQFTAARAELHGTNALLDLTGNPVWRAGLREGKGDSMRINLAREEMFVQGNALMRMPAAELGQAAVMGRGATNQAKPKPAASGFAEIHSQQYFVTAASALFNGAVRIDHPLMKWSCDELTLLSLPELGKQGHLLIAEPYVVFDILDDQGRAFHGTGRKVVYTRRITPTATNDVMELTGRPAIITATNLMGYNDLITLDLGNHTVVAPGKYHIEGTLPSSATNMFRLPKRGRAG
jgi:lipopolysaccharide export system protein LptA